MKIGKIDIVFLIIYLIILILLFLTIDITVSWEGSPTDKYSIRWDRVSNILLYAILVPIIYFGIRWYALRKKEIVIKLKLPVTISVAVVLVYFFLWFFGPIVLYPPEWNHIDHTYYVHLLGIMIPVNSWYLFGFAILILILAGTIGFLYFQSKKIRD